MSDVSKMNLATKLAKISEEVGAIPKEGLNQQQHYAFIEYAAVAAKVSQIQGKYNVAIIPSIKSHSCTEITAPRSGQIGYHYVLIMSFRIINGDNPEEIIESDWVGEASDYGDKGVNKAVTAGVKYFTMRLYNISEKGDDADLASPGYQKPKNKPMPKPKATTKIDFNEVRKKLPTISTPEGLEDYWRSLGHMSDSQAKFLQGMFKKRKEELLNAKG